MNSIDKTFDDNEYDDDISFNDNPYDTFDRAFDDSKAFNDDTDSLFYSEPRQKPSSVYDLYDLTHVNPVVKRKISTLQEAVETRQAASSEQKQLAEELKKRELPNNHTYTKKRCTINCIKCARNLNELYTSILQNRPSGVKGKYFKSLFICTSMGPSIKLDLDIFN